ncbi:hypothetical protein [Clostridium sp.]|jgi:hypothetical protein|uniref:hypothetical protein n=1 Tax=Clostridium sp. TaxID=1506 RepID=UPI003EEDC747
MEDKLIEFETAKLAKEKGFNLLTPKYYTTENPHSYHKDLDGVCILGLMHSNTLYNPQDELDEETGISFYKLNPGIIYAPTQSLLQKWLREVHDLDVYVIPNGSRDKSINKRLYHPQIWVRDKYQTELHSKHTYEQALEKGLIESLKLI